MISNTTIRQVIINVVTRWGVVALQAAIGLFMVPFLLGHMGKEGYGVIGLLMSVIGLTEIADLGLRSALNRELSEKVSKKDLFGFQSLTLSAMVVYLSIAVILASVCWYWAPWITSVFNVKEPFSEQTIFLLKTFVPLSIVLSFITPVFSAGICSFMRYDVQNNISMFSQLCISLGLFLAISIIQTNPLLIWCAVTASGGLIRLMVMIFYHRRVCFAGRLSKGEVRWCSLQPLFKLGGSMYILQLTQVLSEKMDPLIISRFLGLGDVAIYQAGSRLPQMVNPIVLAIANQLTPLTTQFHVEQKLDSEQQVLILATKYTLYLGGIFSAGMIMFADSFCHLWLFDKLGDDVTTVALILKMWAVINLLNYVGSAQFPLLLGKNKLKFAIWLNVPTAIMNIALSVYLVGYTNLGVKGVLVGTLVSTLIRRPLSIWYAAKIINLPLSSYLRKGLLPGAVLWVCALCFGHLIKQLAITVTWDVFVICILTFGLCCLTLVALAERKILYTLGTDYFAKAG